MTNVEFKKFKINMEAQLAKVEFILGISSKSSWSDAEKKSWRRIIFNCDLHELRAWMDSWQEKQGRLFAGVK